MSITFTFGREVIDPDGSRIIHHGADHSHHNTCTADACEDRDSGWSWCDHTAAAEEMCGCTSFDVNLSNANAYAVLERLGVEPEDYDVGQMDAHEMIGRAMVGNVGRDDSGILTTDTGRQAHGPRVIDFGVPAGYYGARLGALTDLAVEAARRGALVVWS